MKQVVFVLILLIGALLSEAAEPTPAQETAFLAQVEKAFAAKDASGLLRLFCFDRTEPALHQKAEDQLVPELHRADFSSAELIAAAPDLAKPYTLNGVTYAPNLEPVRSLIIHFRRSSPSAPASTTMLVGMKDGSLAIAMAAPVPNP